MSVRRPPHHQPALGPGGGDIEQPELFSRLLVNHDLPGSPPIQPTVGQIEVTHPIVVEFERPAVITLHPGIPTIRQIDDRKLQPFGAMERHDLHRIRIGLHPTGAFIRTAVGLEDVLRQPGHQSRGTEPVTSLGRM